MFVMHILCLVGLVTNYTDLGRLLSLMHKYCLERHLAHYDPIWSSR